MSILIVGSFVALAAWGTRRMVTGSRRRSMARTLVGQFNADPGTLLSFYSDLGRFRLETLNGDRSSWRAFVMAISPTQVVIRDLESEPREAIQFAPADLRWFGRPKKYTYGTNTIWLHVEQDHRWQLVRVRLQRQPMQVLVRALKQIATPEQVTAYRRRRPYVHHGPVLARPSTQDVLGAWTLGKPLSLYIMPAFLVTLEGAAVQRTIPLEAIQNVSAARRIDQPDEDGLVRFEAAGAAHAYALDDYEAFAQALSEAARRTLEDPVLWQRKKKKPAPDEIDAIDIDELDLDEDDDLAD